MPGLIERNGILGEESITYYERDRDGEYSYIDGEWIWIKEEC